MQHFRDTNPTLLYCEECPYLEKNEDMPTCIYAHVYLRFDANSKPFRCQKCITRQKKEQVQANSDRGGAA